MAGRTGGGAGDAAQSPSVAGARQFRAFAGTVPAGVLTHSTHSGCVGAPPGDTTVPCQELADGSAIASPKARPGAAVKTPRWSAGRRAGPVWPVISGRISGDRLG